MQTPQATVHSSEVAEAWLAWHSIPDEGGRDVSTRIFTKQTDDDMFDESQFEPKKSFIIHSAIVSKEVNSQRSMMWFRQIAQLSTTMSQAHSATAFHWGEIRITDKHYLTDTFTAGRLIDTEEKGNDRLLNQRLTSEFHLLALVFV